MKHPKKPRNKYAKELRENRLYALKVENLKKSYTRKQKHKGELYDY